MSFRFLKPIVLSFFIVLFSIPLIGQHTHSNRNHMDIGAGLSKVIREAGVSPALHLHYLRSLKENSPLSLTVGLESILDEHKHTTIGLGLDYNFWKDLSFGTSLGLSLTPDEALEPSLHFELAYEFELDKIHLGPMLEYGLGFDHSHVMLGLHVGIGF
jgi:hypothetical protein